MMKNKLVSKEKEAWELEEIEYLEDSRTMTECDPSEYDTTWTDFDTETRGNSNPDNWWKDENGNWVCIDDFPIGEQD